MAERKPPPDLARRLGSVLRSAQDRSLGLRAVRAGLLKEADLAGPIGIEDLLRVKGVAPERIQELRGELDREDYALFRPDRAMPLEVSAVLGEPDRRIAEFVRVSRLGQGGIGEVWKAWDARLGRWVAIKLPMATPDAERATERFSREALAAARLSHPNIVSIHRVAEENGRCFIVMQYVEGKSLRGMKLDLPKALEVMRDVSLGVHYAHEQGVIHRDLKPGNIVIGADGRPFILDFGLAHLQEAGRVQSRDGLVAGTASYMSPEQARGEPAARERATDVYALGATLYELVTGRPPFDGASFAETLQKVLYGELVSPRSLQPSLPRDVEIVIQKAMDKEPRRRYATAKDLADELGRCLAGEPVSARQGAITHTLRRSVKRNRGLVWAAAGAVLLGVGYRAWRTSEDARGKVESEARLRDLARERERELRGFRDMARISIDAIKTLRRAGANERMGEFLTKLEAACAGMRARKIESPELEGFLGRGYRAALQLEKARECQEKAMALAPQYGPARYELYVLARIGGIRPVRGSELDAATILGLTDLEDTDRRTLEGMIADERREFDRSRELLERVVAEDPTREEAWVVLARTHLAGAGDYVPWKVQEPALRKAEAVYTRALDQDRGYPPFWQGRGETRARLAQLLHETGRDPVQLFQSAEDDFTRTIKLEPSVGAWVGRALVRIEYGTHRSSLGDNPVKEFDLADEDLAQAAHLDRKDPAVLGGRSFALRSRAEYRVSRGESPLKELETMESVATAYLAEKKALTPEAWMNLGLLWAEQGNFRGGLGEDPTSDFARADDAFGKVEKSSPITLHAKWAMVRVLHARLRAKLRGDPTPDLEKARADLEQVFPAAGFYNEAKITQAMYGRTKGEQEMTCGHDPTPSFEDARRCLIEVLEANPVSAAASAERGHLELSWGRYRTKVQDRRGGLDHYGMAVRYFEEAIKINEALTSGLRDWLREARRGMLGAY